MACSESNFPLCATDLRKFKILRMQRKRIKKKISLENKKNCDTYKKKNKMLKFRNFK